MLYVNAYIYMRACLVHTRNTGAFSPAACLRTEFQYTNGMRTCTQVYRWTCHSETRCVSQHIFLNFVRPKTRIPKIAFVLVCQIGWGKQNIIFRSSAKMFPSKCVNRSADRDLSYGLFRNVGPIRICSYARL